MLHRSAYELVELLDHFYFSQGLPCEYRSACSRVRFDWVVFLKIPMSRG